MPWADGFAAIGSASDESKGFFWVVKLDKNGKKMWDRSGPELPGGDAAVAQDQSLVLMGNLLGHDGALSVARLNVGGDVVARANTAFLEGRPVQSVVPTDRISIVGVDKSFQSSFFSFSSNLVNASAHKIPSSVGIRDGGAYILKDGSLVLFGTLVGTEFRAAIERVDLTSGRNQIHTFTVREPHDSSPSIRGVIQLSATQFVVMRDQVGVNPASSGVVLAWIAFR